jgi:dephospho-CoA kinase
MKSILIGLTGGIGCGKTEVAKIFQALGARVIDADRIGKEVVESQPEVLQEIIRVFGLQFQNADGSLKRKELGSYIFADKERKKKLNGIVHPHLWTRVKEEAARARQEGHAVIIVDAALVYETGLEKHFDKVIVVNSTIENRIARILQRDHLSEEEIRNRINSQIPMVEKVRRADIIIDNNGSLDELHRATVKAYRHFADT